MVKRAQHIPLAYALPYLADQQRECALKEYLAQKSLPSLTPERQQRLFSMLLAKLQSITIVCEDFSDPHNVGAIMRTAEGLGLTTIHTIHQQHPLPHARTVVRGTSKWIQEKYYHSSDGCLSWLKQQGFTLVAAHVGPTCIPLESYMPLTPIAIIMGSEHQGLSPFALSKADVHITIPMPGMVGSFNVSVAAAIFLHWMAHHRRSLLQQSGDLSVADIANIFQNIISKSTL